MQQLPEDFISWYDSLKIVKANKGPANGSIATALVVLDRLMTDFNLDFTNHVAKGGMQIRGASGTAVAGILSTFGENRPFAKEGGRTNRGGPAEIKALLEMLEGLHLGYISKEERNGKLLAMQFFLVDRVKDFHNRQKIKLAFNPTLSTWHIIHNLLLVAISESKAGPVAQHLIGAKLQLRFPHIKVSNESASTADMQTNRPGDFLIEDTAFHITVAPMQVTVAPMQAVYEKCLNNILEGYKPLLLVPDNKLVGARQIAEQIVEQQIAVESIESFVSQNMNEISNFGKFELTNSFKRLIEIYNIRVNEAETDKSLMIELPMNLF